MHKKFFIKILLILLGAGAIILLAVSYTTFLPQPAAAKDAKSITILTYKNIPLSTLDGFHTKYPDYKVNIERYSKLNYLSFLDTKLNQENSIDIIELPAASYSDYISQDKLLPVTSLGLFARINSSALKYLKNTSNSTYYYGVPYQSNYLGVWYNVSLFEKYNLDPPDNLEHFLTACRVLAENKISPLAVGLSDDDAANNLLTLLTAETFSSVDTPVNASNGFSGIEAPACLSALQICYDMLGKGYLPEACLQMTDEQAFQAFLHSSYAMVVSPENSISMIDEAILNQIDINVCGFFVEGGDTPAVIGTPVDSVLSINMKSANVEICKTFLDYYTQYDTVFQYINDTRTMTTIQNYSINPTLTSAWNRIKSQNYYDPAEHFYLSPFLCDADTYALPRELFYNLITPQEFVDTLQRYNNK